MRTTAAETERNNQMIIDAAIKVFAEKGYEAANMADIANAAGISRGPLYYRYKTKKELFSAAFTEQTKRELDEYARILFQDKHILDIFRDDLDFCTRSSRLHRQFPVMSVPNLPEMSEEHKLLTDASLDCFEMKVRTVERAIAKGEMRKDTDPRRVVNMMFVFARGLLPADNPHGIVYTQNELLNAIDDFLYLVKSKYCLSD